MIVSCLFILIMSVAARQTLSEQPTLVDQDLYPESNHTNCTVTEGEVIQVQAGWPLAVQCVLPTNYDDRAASQCTLSHAKSHYVLVNHTEVPTFYFKQVNQSFDMLMTVLDKKQSCSIKELQIQVVKQQNPTSCEQVNTIVSKEFIVGNQIKLECEIPKGMTVNKGEIQVSWLLGCSMIQTATFQTNNSDLMIPAASPTHAGVYTCAVEYNGQIQYLSKFRVCIRAKSQLAATSISCPNSIVRSKVGRNASLQCSVEVGRDIPDPSVALVTWTKVSSGVSPITKCTTNFPSQSNHSVTNSAVSCQATTKVETCHQSSTTSDQTINNTMNIDFDLFFRNVEDVDYGDYNVKIQFSNGNNFTATVSLQRYDDVGPSKCVLELKKMITNCTNVPSETYDIIDGFPFIVSCNSLTPPAQSTNTDHFECLIFDAENGQVLLNTTQVLSTSNANAFTLYHTDVLRSDSPTNFISVTKIGSHCWARRLHLTKLFRAETCKPKSKTPSMWENVCFDTHSLASDLDLEVSWLRNCSQSVFSGIQTPLSRQKSDLDSEYSCAVTHKEITTYAGSYKLCKNGVNLPLLSCDSDVVLANVGKSAQIDCLFTMERSSLSTLHASWNKNNFSSASICENFDLTRSGTGLQENITCESVTVSTCVMYNAAKDGFLAVDQRKMTLSTSSVREQDFGSYELRLKSSSGDVATLSNSVVLRNADLEFKKINEECQPKPAITLNAYMNWPFTFRCNVLEDVMYNSFYESYEYTYAEDTAVECMIWKNRTGELLMYKKSTMDTLSDLNLDMPDIESGSPRHFLVVVKTSSDCWTQPIFVNATNLPQQTCEEATYRAANTSINSLILGNKYRFLCNGKQPHLHDGGYVSNFQVSWLKNCSVLSNKSYGMMTGSNKPTFNLANVTFEHPGVYTCAVTHNGQTQYLTHYPVCVKRPQSFSRELKKIKCSKRIVHAKVGFSVTLNCSGDAKMFRFRPRSVVWKKIPANNQTLECATRLSSEPSKQIHGNISCKASGIPEEPCYSYVPKGTERNPTTGVFQTSLTFNNVREEDFGRYAIMFSWGWGVRDVLNSTIDLVQETVDVFSASCKRKPVMTVNAHLNWPFVLRCDVLESEMYDETETESEYDYTFPESNPVECTIWQNNTSKLLFHKTGILEDLMSFNLDMPDVEKASPRHFLVVLKSSSTCWAQPIFVNATTLQEQTCEEALSNLGRKQLNSASIGKTISLECAGDDVDLQGGSSAHAQTLLNVTWLRNCTAVGNENYRKSAYSNKPRMHINTITYEHPGIYTCAVTHNGQTQYVTHYPVCVKQASSFSRVLVKCTKSVVPAKVGSRVSLNCTGDLGYYDVPYFMASVRWMKIDTNNNVSMLCFKSLLSNSARYFSGNISCDATMVRLPCFSHIAQGNERNPKSVKIQASVTFEDVHEDDFASYMIVMSVGRSAKSQGGNPNATVQLTQAEYVTTEKHSTHTKVIASCIAVVGLLIIAAVGFVAYHRCKTMKPVVKYTNHQFVHLELKNQISIRSKA